MWFVSGSQSLQFLQAPLGGIKWFRNPLQSQPKAFALSHPPLAVLASSSHYCRMHLLLGMTHILPSITLQLTPLQVQLTTIEPWQARTGEHADQWSGEGTGVYLQHSWSPAQLSFIQGFWSANHKEQCSMVPVPMHGPLPPPTPPPACLMSDAIFTHTCCCSHEEIKDSCQGREERKKKESTRTRKQTL